MTLQEELDKLLADYTPSQVKEAINEYKQKYTKPEGTNTRQGQAISG